MKGRLVAACLGLALCGTNPVWAVPVPTQVTTGIAHQALFDVAFCHGNGYAVGAGGQIEYTADGGKTWKTEQSPTPLSLLGVAVNGSLAVAVGQMGTVLVKDGKGAWEQVPSGVKERLMKVAIRGDNVVAVGAFGAFIRSQDRGRTWSKIGPDWQAMYKQEIADGSLGFNFEPSLYVANYDWKGDLFVAGELGAIIRSSDNGTTWEVVRPGEASTSSVGASIFGLSVNSKGVGVAVGQNGLIVRTADGGATWNPVDSGTTSILLGALAKSDGTILVTGAYSMLWSDDGGEKWTPIGKKGGLVASAWYSNLAGNARTDGTIVVGQSATILRVN